MSNVDSSTIEKYRLILSKDPNSQIFAPLADALRENKDLENALKTARNGVQRHPKFAGGFIILAKILKDMGKKEEALGHLVHATELAPQNILAHQILGETYFELRRPKEALKSFKMVLFLNPSSEKAERFIAKLESITADEYPTDVFEMAKLSSIRNVRALKEIDQNKVELPVTKESNPTKKTPTGLERMLSLIDAFIVRNELIQAQNLLNECQYEYGNYPEITQRTQLIQKRAHSAELLEPATDSEADVAPLVSRKQQIKERKLQALEMLLRKIECLKEKEISPV